MSKERRKTGKAVERMVRFSFQLPAEMMDAVRAVAEKQGYNPSQLMRRALRECINKSVRA